MDTRTGEVFQRDQAGELVGDYGSDRERRRARERMADALARHELVPVSPQVAQLIEDGQRVQRKRRRKAARRARRASRRR